MENIQKLLFLLSTIVMNGFLLSDQTNIFAERMAINAIARNLFEAAQNCNHPDIFDKQLKEIQNRESSNLQLIQAFYMENNSKTPEMVALERAEQTKSANCADLYFRFIAFRSVLEAELQMMQEQIKAKNNLIAAGFSFNEESEE